MTEQEAKTKWCPATFAAPIGNHATAQDIIDGRKCVGSACMAWRWVHVADLAETRGGHPGYCGLAGRP